MFKLNSGSNRENLLNSRFKYQCDEKRIRKIRRTLLTLAEIDMKTSKLYNVTVIKNEENENKMEAENIISQKTKRSLPITEKERSKYLKRRFRLWISAVRKTGRSLKISFCRTPSPGITKAFSPLPPSSLWMMNF